MPPAHTRPIGNPFGDPTFRAQLSRTILGEIERITGRTPWNNNRDNVPAARITGNRLVPEVATRGNIPRANRVVTVAPPARAEHKAENRVVPSNGCTDTRMQILNLLIILVVINFVLTFSFFDILPIFNFFKTCKIEKGQKVYTMKQLYSIHKNGHLGVATYTEPQHLNC